MTTSTFTGKMVHLVPLITLRCIASITSLMVRLEIGKPRISTVGMPDSRELSGTIVLPLVFTLGGLT
ncbi:MAG TPA: hypothetical protein VMH23_16220 [Bacteroidota bacterium]|nr:hypothetical protein [Bacteroidota bacterium]